MDVLLVLRVGVIFLVLQGSSALVLIGFRSDLERGYFNPFQRRLSFCSSILPCVPYAVFFW